MTRNQYRTAIERLGILTVVGGSVLGISRRQAQRIYAGDCPVPEPLAKLIRLMEAKRVKPEDLP